MDDFIKKGFRFLNRQEGLKEAFWVFIISRLAVFSLPFLAGFLESRTLKPFLESFSWWDGGWYLEIVQKGYFFLGPETQSNIVFFPFYPFLGKILTAIFHSDLLSLFLISNVSFFFLLLFMFKIAKKEFDDITARKAIIYLAIFPISFIFSSLYSESLFIALVVAAFYCALRKRWHLSVGLASLASLTRITGILILPALYLLQRQQRATKKIWLLFIPLLAPLSFFIYLGIMTKDPLAYFTLHSSAWGHQLQWPWEPTLNLLSFFQQQAQTSYGFALALFNLSAIFIFLYLLVLSWKNLPRYLFVYVGLVYLLAFSTGIPMYPLDSKIRYLLPAFPVFLTLAQLSKKYWWIEVGYLFYSALFFAPLALHFFAGHWVF